MYETVCQCVLSNVYYQWRSFWVTYLDILADVGNFFLIEIHSM